MYNERNVEQITRVNSILFSIIIFYAKATHKYMYIKWYD